MPIQSNIPQPGLFITGTNTDVGKTYVTSLIAQELISQGLQVGLYKPVCTGVEVDEFGHQQWGDVQQLASVLGGAKESTMQQKICPQCFLLPAAPPVAAAAEQQSVDPTLLITGLSAWQNDAELMLVEGVGGLLCPLTTKSTVADFANEVGYPLLIVAAVELGMINHTLQTLEVAQNRQLSVAGIILSVTHSEVSTEFIETNRREISSRIDVPILAIVQHQQSCDLRTIEQQSKIDWCQLAMGES